MSLRGTNMCTWSHPFNLSHEHLTYSTTNKEDSAFLDIIKPYGFRAQHFWCKGFYPMSSSCWGLQMTVCHIHHDRNVMLISNGSMRWNTANLFYLYSALQEEREDLSLWQKTNSLIAAKDEKPHCIVMSWLQWDLSFSLLCFTVMCLRWFCCRLWLYSMLRHTI